MSWTLLPRRFHICSSFSTLASCLWACPLQAGTHHDQHSQMIRLSTYLPWSHLATLLKAAPLFDQHLLESRPKLFLVDVFSCHSCRSLLLELSIYLLMFALNWKLPHLVYLRLLMFARLQSVCTSEFFKVLYIGLLYCMSLSMLNSVKLTSLSSDIDALSLFLFN